MITKAFFDEPIDRYGTSCEKWDCLKEREGRDLLAMWVADMDFRCTPQITEAIRKRAEHPVFGYTEQPASAVEAMLDFLKRHYGLEMTAEQQLLLPCVVTGLKIAVRALTMPGDRVLITPPVYGPFFSSIALNDRETVCCPLQMGADGSYAMDWDALEQECRKGVKLMLLCNPHNPAGRAWTRDELTRLWTLLKQYGVTLVSDEIHADFVYKPSVFTPSLSVAAGENDAVVMLTSASKTFNIAGLQQAALLTRNQELKQKLEQEINAAGITQGNIFALVATEAAYRYGDEWLSALLDYLAEAKQILAQELATRLPEAILTPMDATYLGWINLRAYGFSPEELVRRTHEAGVAFTAGTFFSEEFGAGFLRVNLGCPHAQTREALRRLEKAIKG